MIDCLVVVPFEPSTAPVLDPHMRCTYLAEVALPLEAATIELENYLGVRLNYWEEGTRPTITGKQLAFPRTRTLAAVVLASALEHAGLKWEAIDPGVRELDWWRVQLRDARRRAPRTVALCTTFVMNYPWLNALCRIIRRNLPESKLLIGGYYYASNAKNFLSLEADVFCVGEGELRLPAIVRAVRDGSSLGNIRGLYITSGHGRIHHTGPAEYLDMRLRPPVDWSLAERIKPTVDLENDLVEVGVETQRGCVFKCEFCSYRTLSPPNALGVMDAADAIMKTGIMRNAAVNIVDATASFPHERWNAILRELIARGGSPHPLWAFARVTDINEESASLMAAAGVKHLFVGQESGDQRILDAMKKGTKIKHVRGAVDALARHRLSATFGFIHGFPGETADSISATRMMIEGLNQGFEAQPPVLTYLVYPFTIPHLASVAAREEFKEVIHYLDYGVSGMDPKRILAEVLETIMVVSRTPHAPAYSHLLLKSVMPTTGCSLFSRHDRTDLFRWLKAVERGIALFLERSLVGTPINDRELREVRDTILAAYPRAPRRPSLVQKFLGKPVLDHLQREWQCESQRGPGLFTRAFTGATVWWQTRDVGLGWCALKTGDLVSTRGIVEQTDSVTVHAGNLVAIAHAQAGAHKYPREALPNRAPS